MKGVIFCRYRARCGGCGLPIQEGEVAFYYRSGVLRCTRNCGPDRTPEVLKMIREAEARRDRYYGLMKLGPPDPDNPAAGYIDQRKKGGQ